MNKIYTLAIAIVCGAFLLSFSTNPPDGNTGAPGEMLCVQCHTQTNPSQNGTISIEGFPAAITPDETYMLTVVNKITEGDAVRAGFQVTILSPTNTKAGNMLNPSQSSAVSIFSGRQYWDHSPAVVYPDSNVVKWTVQWTAPNNLPAGSQVTWYAAGNIADGNFSNVGDRIVAATGSGSIVLSDVEEASENSPIVFPNPGSDHLFVKLADETEATGQIKFYTLSGQLAGQAALVNGYINTPTLPAGVYLLEINILDQLHFMRWSKL